MLKTQIKLKPVVSAKWLSQHLHDPNLLILDASLKDNKAGLKSEYEGVQIENARFFDLKNTNKRKNKKKKKKKKNILAAATQGYEKL